MNFVVVGAGAWGTAFALHLVRAGHAVTLVPRRAEQAVAMAKSRDNHDYLPGIRLPLELSVQHELAPALQSAEVVLLACPAQALRETAGRVKLALGTASRVRLVASLAKGLELG